jgi:pentapeptide MXKDX repeat protein
LALRVRYLIFRKYIPCSVWNAHDPRQLLLHYFYQQELQMKKAVLIATCVAALSAYTTVGAFAQSSTGPAAQQDTMTKDKMGKEGMKKEGTTGMHNDSMAKDRMTKDGMSKDMSKEGSPKADTKKGN